MAKPAELPLFAPLRQRLIERLELKPEVVPAAEELAPEVFMRVLREGRLPLEAWLTAILSRGSPNAVHCALAYALREGATVWTVNVDKHIENAASRLGHPIRVASYPDHAPAPEARLLKPHGTVDRGEYIFRADQVLVPLAPGWAARLEVDMKNADVVAIGYQGLDIDMRVVLARALEGARTVTWFCTDVEWPKLIERLPALQRSNVTPATAGTGPELTTLFLSWAKTAGMTAGTPADVTAVVGAKPQPVIDPIEGDVRLARALLYERAGDRRSARRDLHRVVMQGPGRAARTIAVARLRTFAFYQPTRLAEVAFWVSGSPLALMIPDRLRRRLDRAHVTVLSSHLGRHSSAVARADRAVDQADPAILIARSKAARYAGDMARALELAERVFQTCEAAGEVDDAAHGLFEIVFAHTWSGAYEQARRALGRFYQGIDALAGVRWIGWAEWHAACLDLYAGAHTSALKHLETTRLMFEADGLVAGVTAGWTVEMTARRMAGDDEGFQAARQEVESRRGMRGWTTYTDHSIAQEVLERRRRVEPTEELRAGYRRLAAESEGNPAHLGLLLLGLAELDRVLGRDNAALVERARRVAADHSLGYLSAHAAIADYLAGRLGSDEALGMIDATGCELATNHGGPARDPQDFCLGPNPSAHALFFP